MKLSRKLFCRVYQLGFRAALPILPYRNPEQLDGVESIPILLKLKKIRSVLLVADGGVRRLGLTGPLERLLKQEDIKVAVYEQNFPNPTINDVEAARSVYKSHRCKAIIAVGGGSAIDCAKVVGARIVRPFKPVSKMKGLLHIILPTPLMIAVPTTAGTGSEATLAAVITDSETHHKYPINDFALIPNYAVLDPKLTIGLPPMLTATTGLDALTHAVEAYIGRSTNALTRSMSEEAVSLIFKYLRRAWLNGEDEEARAGMLRASYCAGVSFTRSYVGYVHGVAHSLGGQYGIAHGLANAVILPVFLDLYGKSCQKKLARLARKAGVVPEGLSNRATARQFIAWIKGMNRVFDLPSAFPEIREEDIPIMAAHADRESNPLYPVPRLMDAKELEKVYYGLMVKETAENGN